MSYCQYQLVSGNHFYNQMTLFHDRKNRLDNTCASTKNPIWPSLFSFPFGDNTKRNIISWVLNGLSSHTSSFVEFKKLFNISFSNLKYRMVLKNEKRSLIRHIGNVNGQEIVDSRTYPLTNASCFDFGRSIVGSFSSLPVHVLLLTFTDYFLNYFLNQRWHGLKCAPK